MDLFGLDYITLSHQRVFWIYLLSSASIALVFIYFFPNTKAEYKTRKIWTHPSAILDYNYFFVVAFIKAVLILPLILSSKEVTLGVVYFLQDTFGYMHPLRTNRDVVVLLYTLSIFILGDFTRYWLHRMLHRIPFLWKIHQIHHSAEVLTPLTFYRVHPIENILFGLRYALSVGFVTGIFIYLFGASIGLVEIVGANLFVFIFGIMGANLRHSHIPLRYGDFIEKIFISPYQHQLHHTQEHSDRNFGGALALWDWGFSTLHREKIDTNLLYGLKSKKRYRDIKSILIEPLLIRRRVEKNSNKLSSHKYISSS